MKETLPPKEPHGFIEVLIVSLPEEALLWPIPFFEKTLALPQLSVPPPTAPAYP